jgi:hypothetical protein
MENLSRQWDADQQLEDLWVQIRKCQAFADAHDPITDETAVRITVNNHEKSRVFSLAIQEWRKRPETKHTINNMKTAFNLANKERLCSISSSAAGFARK